MRYLSTYLFAFAGLSSQFSSAAATNGSPLLTPSQTIKSPAAACASLGKSIKIKDVTVNFAQHVPAGTNITLSQDYDLASYGYKSQVVSNDLCRVAMYVATSGRSGELIFILKARLVGLDEICLGGPGRNCSCEGNGGFEMNLC
jgi:hypothetical protein